MRNEYGFHGYHGYRSWGIARVVVIALGGIVVACALGLALGMFVQWLWNATLVKLFAVPMITYWQAVGLFVLAKLFFGGIGHHGPHDHMRRHWGKPWKQYGCRGEEREAFERFWEDEGQKAFDAYLERMKAEGAEPKD